jgi:hypothetical protein
MKYFFSFLLRGQKGKNFRYPTGNNLAEGQSWFKQSRFSRDCLKKISLRSLRLVYCCQEFFKYY